MHAVVQTLTTILTGRHPPQTQQLEAAAFITDAASDDGGSWSFLGFMAASTTHA